MKTGLEVGRLSPHADTISDMPARLNAAPPATCPNCGHDSTSDSTVRRDGPVLTGNYICANDHIWLARWTDAIPGRD